MKWIGLMMVMVVALSPTTSAFADCAMANCDERKVPGSCDRAQAALKACLDAQKPKPPKDPNLGQKKTVPPEAINDKSPKGAVKAQ
jgi:hypothetical protein